MNKNTRKVSIGRDELFLSCLKKVKDELKNVEITVSNFIYIIQIVMEIIEVTRLKGEQQKHLATGLIREIIIDAPISDVKEKLMLDMIDEGIVANMIDTIVSASKGELNINSTKKVAKICCFNLLKKNC